MLSPFLGGSAAKAPAGGAPARRAGRPGRPAKAAKPAKAGRKARGSRPATAKKPSGETSKGRALQGRYMGVIRSLTASQKKDVKTVRAEKGVEAAIDRAVELRKD